MAKKVTVSIPDLLHEKMEKWRSSFNLSKMFQDAVAEAIQKKEDFQKRIQDDRDLNEIIERLRKEKARSEGGLFDAGRSDGQAWARSAHYDDLLYALHWDGIEHGPTDPVLGPYFQEKIAGNRHMDSQNGQVNEYFRIYASGWQQGVADFWEAIQDKI